MLDDVLEMTNKEVKVKEQLTIKDQRVGTHHTITISTHLQQLIMGYVKETFPREIAKKEVKTYLFPSQKGHNLPLSRQSLWRIIHHAAQKSGIHIGTHSLKKTFGYFLYQQGVQVELIEPSLEKTF